MDTYGPNMDRVHRSTRRWLPRGEVPPHQLAGALVDENFGDSKPSFSLGIYGVAHHHWGFITFICKYIYMGFELSNIYIYIY
jgi:hypothetical protein